MVCMGGESWYTTKIFKPHSQISRLGMHGYSIFPWDHFNHLNFYNFNLKCLNMEIFTQEDFLIPERFLTPERRFFTTRFKISIAPPFLIPPYFSKPCGLCMVVMLCMFCVFFLCSESFLSLSICSCGAL